MATIASTLSPTPLDFPSHPGIARSPQSPNYLYAFGRSDNSNTFMIWRSIDGGSSWGTWASFNRSGVGDWSSLVLDKSGYAYIAYRWSDSSFDRLYYRRCNLSTATWEAELQVSGTNGSGNANGGVQGSFWTGVDLAVVRNPNNSTAAVVVGGATYTTAQFGVWAHGVSWDSVHGTYLNNGIISGTRGWFVQGTSPGAFRPVCESEHTGDGFSGSTPNVWISWGRTKLYQVKLAWKGPTAGWQGPSGLQTISTAITASDSISARWDTSRWLACVTDNVDTTLVTVYERNQSNTSTTVRQTPTHPQGVVKQSTVSYDSPTKNIRITAVGTTNSTPYFIDYVRATGLWGSWVQITSDAITTSSSQPRFFAVRKAGTYGNARYDGIYTLGTVSPWTIKTWQQTSLYAPNTPTWDTSVIGNGSAQDVAATMTLDWNFSDNDPTDSQASYALRRQIGAGTLNYYNAGTGLWTTTEVFNTSATTAVTLAIAWGLDADANHQYAVKTRDTGGLDSGYSAQLTIIPSTKVNPSITTPTAAQVLTTNFVTMTWTVAAQKAYRVWLLTNPGLVQVYDSGWRVDPAALSFTVPYEMADSTGWQLWLQTTNAEGLPSTTQTRNFTIDYTEPPTPTIVATPVPASGWISVAITNPSPTGSQPVFVAQNLHRRLATTPVLNSNPSMAGNTTGWVAAGGVLTYSTVQFHDSPGAARLVPSGVAADSQVAVVGSTAPLIVAGNRYTVSGWIRPDTVNKSMRLAINFYDAGGSFISAQSVVVSTPVAAIWYFLTFTGDSTGIASVARAGPAIGTTGTPAAGDAFYADELIIELENTDTGTRIASGLGAGPTITDWRAAARTSYEYRATAYAINGTQSASPWTT